MSKKAKTSDKRIDLEVESNRIARTWTRAGKKRRRAIDLKLLGICLLRREARA